MKRTNIHITSKQYNALKEINELSLAEHIRRAIDLYLKGTLNVFNSEVKVKETKSAQRKGP